MATLSGEAKGLSLLAFEGAAVSYSAWLPSIFTIRTFGDSQLAQRDLVHGLVLGTGFNLIVGIGASVLAGTSLPLWGALLGSAVGIAIYLYAMSTAHGLGAMKAQSAPQEASPYGGY